MQSYYKCFSSFSNYTYESLMKTPSQKPMIVSKQLRILLLTFLDGPYINDKILGEFSKKIKKVSKKLMKTNTKIKKELFELFPKFHDRITDLNSVVMGVPNDNDSDLDFTIEVKTIKEQKNIGETLKSNGYKLDQIYEENTFSRIKWHSYQKYVNNIEIEVKVRSEKIMSGIKIAHKGIKNDLTPLQKLKVSFIKSVLSHGDKRTYKTFKYILYVSMFNGHKKSVVFRHD